MITTLEKKNYNICSREIREGWFPDEPDFKIWVGPEEMMGMVLRNSNSLILCGYVGVRYNHKYITWLTENGEMLDCHGGVNWPGRETDVLINDNPYVWWGFDCDHGCDLQPGRPAADWFRDEYASYRSLFYVEDWVNKMMQQVIDANS